MLDTRGESRATERKKMSPAEGRQFIGRVMTAWLNALI